MTPLQNRKQHGVTDAEFNKVFNDYHDNKGFRMNPRDISYAWGGSASAKHRKKRNRKCDLRSSRITLVHRPTGVEVSGEVPEGHYSKKEMQEKCDDMYHILLPTLEAKVRKYIKDRLEWERNTLWRTKNASNGTES